MKFRLINFEQKNIYFSHKILIIVLLIYINNIYHN